MSPNGPDCGSGGQLAVDSVTGIAMNCDGSAYGDTVVDHLDAGGSLYQQCVACHNADGSGGVGPAFTGGAVLATFPSGACLDHAEWNLCRYRWLARPDVRRKRKGCWSRWSHARIRRLVNRGTDALAQVALYERVQFGGQDLAEAEADCGLADEGVEASAEG